MSGSNWRAADDQWAVRHKQVLTDLVMAFALAATHDRNFADAVAAIPAWQTARASVLGDGASMGVRPAADSGTSASALLRELVTGMQAAGKRDPVVARLFSKRGWTVWAVACRAVTDDRQWRRVRSAEQPYGRPAAGRRS